MREYKFRCWYCNKMRYDITGFEFYSEGNLSGVFIDGDFADEIELMQFTGLHDKNGKEIYEGDIVDVTRPCIYETGRIVFKNGCFFIKVKETLLALWECEPNNYQLEVIGNIYENSNLLKGADNIE